MNRLSLSRVAAALAVCLVLAGAAPILAQAGDAPLKIALIDVQRLVTDSAAGKDAIGKLKKLQEVKVAEGKAKQDEMAALQKKLDEGRLSLAEDKLAEIQKQIEDRQIAFRRFSDDAQREIQKAQETAFGDIEKRVMPIIEKAGKEFGYTMIFNKFQSGLVYAADGIDITDLIIQRFDAAKGQ